MILNICNMPEFLEIMVFVKRIINFLKIGAPVVLIIMIMIDVFKAVASTDQDEIKKKTKLILPRLLVAAILYLVPTVTELTLNMVDSQLDYATCFTNAESTLISQLYIDRADTTVTAAEQALDKETLSKARKAVNSLDDSALKNQYLERLKKVERIVYPPSGYPEYQNSAGNTEGNTKFPYYNQCDSRWSSVSLESDTYNTCGCGCGYVSLTMVIAGLNRDASITPDKVVPYVRTFSNWYCAITDVALYDSKITEKYGIKPTVLFYRSYNHDKEMQKEKIINSLNNNNPVIVLVPGHYIVLSEINNGKITVLDPGGSSWNGVYTWDELYNKYYNRGNYCTNEGVCGFIYAISYSKV